MRLATIDRATLFLTTVSMLATSAAFGQVPVSTNRRVFHPDTAFVNERFGSSVDTDGSTVVVGVVGDDVADPSQHGRVEVWKIDTSTPGPPVLEAVLTPAPGQATNDRFGAAVAIYDDTVIVGAPGSDVAGANFGAAYVFERSYPSAKVGGPHDAPAAVWTQTAQLLPNGPYPWTGFGRSVDVHLEIVVVGSEYGDTGVMAFKKQPSGWTSISGGLESDWGSLWGFGYSVAIYRNLIAVGEPWYTDDYRKGLEIGALYVFRWSSKRTGNSWEKASFLVYQAAVNFEQMGSTVGMTLSRATRPPQVVLAAGTSHSVRLWNLSGQGLALNNGGNLGNPAIPAFGRHLAIKDSALLVSGDESSPQQAVSLYRRNASGLWPEVARFLPTTPPQDEGYGHSLAVGSDFLLIGSDLATRDGMVDAGWVSWVSD